MAIWKIRTRQNTTNTLHKRYRKALCAAVLLSSLSLASGEITTQLKLTPLYTMPIASSNFTRGLGASLAVEVQPVKLLCLTAEGEYISLSKNAEGLDAVNLISVNAGAGVRIPIGDRFVFGADLLAGLYNAADAGNASVSGFSAGARISFFYRFSPSLSAGIQASPSHYAYMPQALMSSVGAGPTIALNLNQAFNTKTNIRTNIQSIDPVYPVLYSWYNDNSFAKVEVFNDEQNTVEDVQVYFYLEQYMNQPKLCGSAEKLNKGESFTADLTAFFNERVLELTEKTDTKAKLIVEYTSLSKKLTKEIPVTVPIYNRNAMSWKDDRRAAAFVSSKDPSALWFAKYISSVVKDSFRSGINTNLQYAMGLFEAVNTFGLNYVIDPSSAYADNIGGESVDFLQFPYQTLMYRGGDCDDISILFCSLLEAVGIDTAFITIPGHIYMAFSTGLTEEDAKKAFADPSLLVMNEGTAWIPLEITLTKEGFDKAWRIGAREWNTAAANNKANLYPMKKSWELYSPISVPGAQASITMPDKNAVTSSFTGSMDVWVEKEIRPRVTSLTEQLALKEDAQVRNSLGVLYAEHGMLGEAENQFTKAAEKKYLPSYINLANIYFTKQDYKKASEWYSKVLNHEPVNTIALLGTARSLYELDDFTNSDIFYAAVKKYDENLAEEYAYLGSFKETKGRSWSLADRLSHTQWITDGNYIVETQKVPPAEDYKTIASRMNIAPSGLTAEISIVQKKDGKITLTSAQKNLILSRSQNTETRDQEENKTDASDLLNSAAVLAKKEDSPASQSPVTPPAGNTNPAEPENKEAEETAEPAATVPVVIKEQRESENEIENPDTETAIDVVSEAVSQTAPVVEIEAEPQIVAVPNPDDIFDQEEVVQAEVKQMEPAAVEIEAEPQTLAVPEIEEEVTMIAVLEPVIAEGKTEEKKAVIEEKTSSEPVQTASEELEQKPVLVQEEKTETESIQDAGIQNIQAVEVQTAQNGIVQITENAADDKYSITQSETPKKNIPLTVLGIIAGLGAAAGTAGVLIGKFFKPKNPKV